MLFLTDDLNYSFSPKFYEYIAMNKPIAYFSLKGKTSEFIEQNKIGYPLNKGHIKLELLKIIKNHQSNNLPSVNNFDTSKYDVSNLTHDVIK